MTNRRSIMAFSGILILLYHLWINLFPGNQIELFLRTFAFVGVDIFFFLSGFSLGGRETGSYFGFIKNRFELVYLKYILFAIAACIYSKWAISRLLQVIVAYEFVTKGGGSFLWFLPAIMILYILFPFYKIADKKAPRLTLILALVIWILLGVLVTYLTSYKAIFIFWMRIPVFMLGFYGSRYKLWEKCISSSLVKAIVGVVLTVLGGVLIYFFGFKMRLSVPMVDFFYVLGIPSTLGLTMLVSFVPEVKPIEWIGKSTLEMYGIQMVFGYKLANSIYQQTENKIITNSATPVIVIVVAVLLQFAYNFIRKQIKSCTTKQA